MMNNTRTLERLSVVANVREFCDAQILEAANKVSQQALKELLQTHISHDVIAEAQGRSVA